MARRPVQAPPLQEPPPAAGEDAAPVPDEDEVSALTLHVTHVVVSTSRGFAWVRARDVVTGLADPQSPVVRCQNRPGVHCVVGDRVEVENGYVVGVGARSNTLSRAVGPKRQLLAAHVDRVVLVLAHGKALREGFLMRGLIACTLQHLRPLVVVNKLDLDDGGKTETQLSAWRALGIACVGTSAVTGQGVAEFTEAVAKGSSALLGHSGVGKSTLINAIRTGALRKTGGVDWQGKGRHITTMAEAIVQPGSMLLDLPGIRELGLWGASTEEVLNAFPDVKTAAAGCQYTNCSHGEDALGCAVWAAVGQGTVDRGRVTLCLRMQHSVAMGTEGGGRI